MEKQNKSASDMQKILQLGQIDVGNETLFSRSDKLSVADDHLTLVISSGGSGLETVARALKIANQKLDQKFKKYMKFLVVDSDSKALSQITDKYSNVKLVNISAPGILQRLEPNVRKEFYKEMIPADFPYTTLDDNGAGKKRLVGRVKFYDSPTVNSYNDTNFRKAIEDLYTYEWSALKNKPVDIMILAGLYGGNGSGTFLDLAAHARSACIQAGGTVENVYGYLFLPDTSGDTGNFTNTYAALKELEDMMSVQYDVETKFPTQNPGVDIKNRRIFDVPVLITGEQKETRTMMAEYLINMVAQNDGTKDSQGTQIAFTQKSFYSNRDTERNMYISSNLRKNEGLLLPTFFPEDSWRYSGIGYAYATIPTEPVIANVISHKMQSVYEFEAKEDDGNKVGFCTEEHRDILPLEAMEAQIRSLFKLDASALDKAGLWNQVIEPKLEELAKKCKNDEGDISKAEVRSGETGGYEAGFHKDECILAGVEAVKTYFAELFTNFQTAARVVMRNYGPGAMNLLYYGIGPLNEKGKAEHCVSVQEMIEGVVNGLADLVSNSVNKDIDLKGGFIDNLTGKNLDVWKKKFSNQIQAEVKREIAKRVRETNGPWDMFVSNLKNYFDACEEFSSRLNLLKNTYRDKGNSLDSDEMNKFVKATEEDNLVNLCNNENIYNWVKNTIRTKIGLIETNTVRDNLIQSFVTNPERWTSNSEGETRREFDRVMSVSCQLGLGAKAGTGIQVSAITYFEYVLAGVDEEHIQLEADKCVRQIVSELITKSSPSMKKRQGSYSVVNRFIMMPALINSSAFGQALIQAFRNNLEREGHGQVAVVTSPSVTDIVCYQTSVCNALTDLTDLKMWEASYNETDVSTSFCHSIQGEPGKVDADYDEMTKTQRDTLSHFYGEKSDLKFSKEEDIIFGIGLSLEHYPPVNLYDSKNNGKEQAFLNNIFNPIVEYALREKIIERKVVGSNPYEYQYVIHVLPDEWKVLDISSYTEVDESGMYQRGKTLFADIAANNKSAPIDVDIRLNGSGWFNNPFDFSEAAQKRRWNQEQVDNQSLEYMKRILRKNVNQFRVLRRSISNYYPIAKQLEEMEKIQILHQQVVDFIEFYKFGVISEQDGRNWIYETQKDLKKQEKKLCSINEATAYNFQGIKKALYKNKMDFLIAFDEFKKLDRQELRKRSERKLVENNNALNVSAWEKTKRNNLKKLEEMREVLKEKLVPEYMDADEITADDLKAYIVHQLGVTTALTKADEILKDTIGMMWIELPRPHREEPAAEEQPEKDWRCPSCQKIWNKEVAVSLRMCPLDMTPWQKGFEISAEKPEGAWKCPVCNNTWQKEIAENLGKCPVDGNPWQKIFEIPAEKPEGPWKCPTCNNTWQKEVAENLKACPIDQTPWKKAFEIPVEKPEGPWKCPTCNNIWQKEVAENLKACPIDQTPWKKAFEIPPEKPEGAWKCPTCNNTWQKEVAENLKACPIDQTPWQKSFELPKMQAPKAKQIGPWVCPTCNNTWPEALTQCPIDQTSRS